MLTFFVQKPNIKSLKYKV